MTGPYGWVTAEEIPGLRLVRERRQLDVACKNDHRLVEVYRSDLGPVVYGQAYAAIGASMAGARRQALAMRLTGPGVHDLVDAQCQCGGTEIPARWILEKVHAGTRRVVWEVGPASS